MRVVIRWRTSTEVVPAPSLTLAGDLPVVPVTTDSSAALDTRTIWSEPAEPPALAEPPVVMKADPAPEQVSASTSHALRDVALVPVEAAPVILPSRNEPPEHSGEGTRGVTLHSGTPAPVMTAEPAAALPAKPKEEKVRCPNCNSRDTWRFGRVRGLRRVMADLSRGQWITCRGCGNRFLSRHYGPMEEE